MYDDIVGLIVKIHAPASPGCSMDGWVEQFKKEIHYEYINSYVDAASYNKVKDFIVNLIEYFESIGSWTEAEENIVIQAKEIRDGILF